MKETDRSREDGGTTTARTVYIEKRHRYADSGRAKAAEIQEVVGGAPLKTFRRLLRYDIGGLTDQQITDAVTAILADPITDLVYTESLSTQGLYAFAVEFLPGQFDQRADSAAEAIEIVTGGIRPTIRVAEVFLIDSDLTDSARSDIERHLVNEVDSRLCNPFEPPRFDAIGVVPEQVATLDQFFEVPATIDGVSSLGLSMSPEDLAFCQHYFRDSENRPPTETELRVLDTYWSDHCRHTTFETKLASISIEATGAGGDAVRDSHQRFLALRRELLAEPRRSEPPTLMELATIGGRWAHRRGLLDDLLVSEEINAATVAIDVESTSGKTEKWYLLFKNETHNHPTEIEPIGGAETCLGGAIRDPLSGRAYVHQAMRITGGADPRQPATETPTGKLPQRTITTQAARGFSSYGNQIGLATGVVHEFFHPGYAAKRMEIGAVVAAAPQSQVVHKQPEMGDLVVLIGGRTGRDGCGGATGSSKAHDVASITEASAEVQKGNPPVERALQRLFRNAEFSRRVKRSNDFGAGGVAVAVGEIAESLEIDLDAIPVKYHGLDGTELAISESQERMAVVIQPSDLEIVIAAAGAENLEATVVARVTDSGRLRMVWRGTAIVDIARSFLDTNGAQRSTSVVIDEIGPGCDVRSHLAAEETGAAGWIARVGRLDAASRKGMSEIFDSTIGAGTLLAPWGGAYQLTPVSVAAARIPIGDATSRTASVISYGFFLERSAVSPYHGAYWSVVEAVARAVCAGARRPTVRMSLQEYFPRVGEDPTRWGLPYAALLGAMEAQLALSTPAIGGKDSMSGTFEDLDVPPTVVAFSFAATDEDRIIGPEFAPIPGEIVCIVPETKRSGLASPATLHRVFDLVERAKSERLLAAGTIGESGVRVALTLAAFGNWCSLELDEKVLTSVQEEICSIAGETAHPTDTADRVCFYLQFEGSAPDWIVEDTAVMVIGSVLRGDPGIDDSDRYGPRGASADAASITVGSTTIPLSSLRDAWFAPLDHLFPLAGTPIVCNERSTVKPVDTGNTDGGDRYRSSSRRSTIANGISRPRVCIPVFPGTNCEYDSTRAFEEAGAQVMTPVFRKRTPDELKESLAEIATAITQSQILMFPGGFSAGDEPDGSGKYIAALFRDQQLREAIHTLYHTNEGLILGICNGFQALVRMGLIPGGIDALGSAPSVGLFLNDGLRHISTIAKTRVSSTLSPWLAATEVGRTYPVPISHGEGRLIASEEAIASLHASGQIATQYVEYNPNGSIDSIEGICSPDGRILGKMGHNERVRPGLYRNLPPIEDMQIFESGVAFFR